MAREVQTVSFKKNFRGHVSKSFNLVKCWNTLMPAVIEHISGPGYIGIPYIIDMKAYQIGHIFVLEASDVQCFCAEPQLKVLGPICDFLLPEKSNSRWLTKDFPAIKTTGDETNFQVILENGKNLLRFRGLNCYFLDKAPDMTIEGEVTIDRSSHEDLATANWFGLITGTVVAGESDVFLKRGKRERIFCVGERPHTILFKYEICKMDKRGSVFETSVEEMECKWRPVQDRDMDSLPLVEFVSQSTRVRF